MLLSGEVTLTDRFLLSNLLIAVSSRVWMYSSPSIYYAESGFSLDVGMKAGPSPHLESPIMLLRFKYASLTLDFKPSWLFLIVAYSSIVS